MELPYPEALRELMEHLRNLPGVGRRTAERMALSIFQWEGPRLVSFAETLRTLHERVTLCRLCGNLADDGAPDGLCAVCSSPARDHSSVCVVETPPQIRVIESADVFRGVYHVLGGRIAPLEGRMAEDLAIDALRDRIEAGGIREVILALSPDVEGQATSVYLANLLKDCGIRITRPAQGLPAGSDLSYADPATVALALNARVALEKDE